MTAAPYAGWQRQANAPSVQQTIEEAILRFSGDAVSSKGAGRTDTGVHALGQVAHFDLSGQWQRRPHPRRDERAAAAGADRDPGGAPASRTISTRAIRPSRGTISTVSSTAALRPRSTSTASGTSAAASISMRCARARQRSSAIMISRPSDRPIARHSSRSRRSSGSTIAPGRRRGPFRGFGTLVPAQSGSLDGRDAEEGRRGKMATVRSGREPWRRAIARPAGRWRRPAGSISPGSTIAQAPNRPLTSTMRIRLSATSAATRPIA